MVDKIKTKVDTTNILKNYANGKKINQVSKTIMKVHKNNTHLNRYREFNEQSSIEPYEGIKEIIEKKSIEGILKEIRNRIKL